MKKEIFQRTSPNSEILSDYLQKWDEAGLVRCFAYQGNHDEHKTKPGIPNLKIKDTSEKAYQRAFFQQKPIRVGEDLEINPLDIEVPVEMNSSSRRRSLDLIGRVKDNNLAIVELKASKGNSPVWGISELAFYAKAVSLHQDTLVTHQYFRDGETVTPKIENYWKTCGPVTHLILAAPHSYWPKWTPYLPRFKRFGLSLLKSYRVDATLIFAEFPDENFKEQADAAKGERYRPRVSDLKWSNVMYEGISSPRR